ncbi:MAG: hypothetical protein AMS26_09000, partial [Bacteroides sp. SM23_62]
MYGVDKNKLKLGCKNLNKNYMLNTLPQAKNAEQIITNTKKFYDMKKFNAFTILLMLFFMAAPLLLNAQVPENGLVFDGDDDYVNISTSSGDELNPDTTITLETWVYLNEAPSGTHTPYLIARLNCYSLTIDNNGHVKMFLRNDEGDWSEPTGSTTIVPNRWYHLAATYDGANARVYLNGNEEGSSVASDTMARTMLNMRLGSLDIFANANNLNGMMDEVRIWDIARSRDDIRSTMNRTIPGTTAGLVGYWRFDESSGTLADDETTYGNNGTLTNMSTPSAWLTSTAPIGDYSQTVESLDITEIPECDVDVDFRAFPETPGPEHTLSAMQVNQFPNSSTGLYPDRASMYWQIWSEDIDFDGNFTADVRFHYDDIGGLPTESSLDLFRRDDVNDTWSPATGYTVVSNDGGASSTTDGIGYIELTITETTAGGFSGQYIISWTNLPPVVDDIPDQSVAEGSAFATINLDDYVDDPDNLDSEITWTVTGETDVTVTITDRVATITADNPEWNGTDMVTFTAEDPEGETDSDEVTFEVTPVNDPPVVGDIPNDTVPEGTAFATINLDNFVTDIDNDITTMIWTATGQSDLTVDITDRVATITVIDTNWNGSDTITFQAEDPDGGTDSDPVTFTVTPVNDPPVVDVIPNQTINEGESFTPIILDDYVSDIDNADSTITWTASLEGGVSVDITDRVATITVNDPEWNGSDLIRFTAKDPDGLQDSADVVFYVNGVNDLPMVEDIPDQTIAEGQSFSQISLDDFVSDADDPDSALTWTVTGQSNLTAEITDRVATITIDDAEWNGSDTLIFTATDTSGAFDTDTTILTVMAVNDPPTLNKAIPDTTAVAEEAFSFILDPNTFADIDPGDSLVLSASMSMGGSTPAWITFDAASREFSGTPADGDKGMVEVIVTAT